VAPNASGGGGWGTLFLILFPVGVAVYLGAGSYYNYKYSEARGVEMIPQIAYWRQVRAHPARCTT
jgi:hypothetical protein